MGQKGAISELLAASAAAGEEARQDAIVCQNASYCIVLRYIL